MAANSINKSMGWKQSREISEEHKAEIKNAIYDILRNMNRFDWNSFQRMIEKHGYSAELRRDTGGKIVGYTIKRGNSKYNASEIGRQLTASRIEATWKQLHKDMDDEAAKRKAEEQNARKALNIADRVYVLETGSITSSGRAEELLNDDSIRKAYLGE